MNRTKMVVFGVFALALSVFVAYYAYRMLSNRLAPPVEETVQIVVAADKLVLGSRITEQQLKLANWPLANLPEGRFTEAKDVVGRGVIVQMSANEPILESKLAPKDAGAGLTAVIPEGMRAVSVRVNDIINVAGFVTPGTHVDVIIVGVPGPASALTSKIFLENVQVLAVGQNVQRDENGKPQSSQVVTLLVTPEDAQKLALAGDSRIQLALRNPIDMVVENPRGVQTPMLYGTSSGAAAPEAPRPRPKPTFVKYSPKPRPEPAAVPATVVDTPLKTVTIEFIKGDKREKATYEMKKNE